MPPAMLWAWAKPWDRIQRATQKAAAAVVAVDDDEVVLAAFDFSDPLLDLAHGEEFGSGDAAAVELILFAAVEEEEGFFGVDPALDGGDIGFEGELGQWGLRRVEVVRQE